MIPVARACLLALGVGWTGSFLTAQSEQNDESPTNLVAWKIAHFSPDELRDGSSDDSRDLRRDGLPNLLRYALGLSPREPAEPLIEFEQYGGRIVVRCPNGTTTEDVSCRLEISQDLKEWNPVGDLRAAEISGDASSVVRFAIDGSLADQPRYFRLTAERQIFDHDEDALEDDLELRWFATTAHGPADDPDEDGVTTAAELSVGRSPQFGIIPDPVLAQRATGLEIYTPHP